MTATTPNTILDGMLGLLATPEAWTKHLLVGIREGNEVIETGDYNPAANCFCLAGARIRSAGTIESENALRMGVNDRIIAAIKTLFPDRCSRSGRFNLPAFNDHPETTHADILSVLRLARAIA